MSNYDRYFNILIGMLTMIFRLSVRHINIGKNIESPFHHEISKTKVEHLYHQQQGHQLYIL